jgi:hypothetical protein
MVESVMAGTFFVDLSYLTK